MDARRDLFGAALRFLCMAPGLTLALHLAARRQMQ